jgi:hypothetical protein
LCKRLADDALQGFHMIGTKHHAIPKISEATHKAVTEWIATLEEEAEATQASYG